VQNPRLKEIAREKQAILLKEKIDVTAFIVWFIEHFPEAADTTWKSDSHAQ